MKMKLCIKRIFNNKCCIKIYFQDSERWKTWIKIEIHTYLQIFRNIIYHLINVVWSVLIVI